jgi:hypothetical protein
MANSQYLFYKACPSGSVFDSWNNFQTVELNAGITSISPLDQMGLDVEFFSSKSLHANIRQANFYLAFFIIFNISNFIGLQLRAHSPMIPTNAKPCTLQAFVVFKTKK